MPSTAAVVNVAVLVVDSTVVAGEVLLVWEVVIGEPVVPAIVKAVVNVKVFVDVSTMIVGEAVLRWGVAVDASVGVVPVVVADAAALITVTGMANVEAVVGLEVVSKSVVISTTAVGDAVDIAVFVADSTVLVGEALLTWEVVIGKPAVLNAIVFEGTALVDVTTVDDGDAVLVLEVVVGEFVVISR